MRELVQDFGDSAELPVRGLSVAGLSTVLFRLSQIAGRLAPGLGGLVKQLNHLLTGADISWRISVGPGLRLYHPTGVVIGDEVTIGARCCVQGSVTIGGRGIRRDGRGYPTIGDGVLLGAGCAVIGPVEVGDNVRVGANAVVLCDVPDGATVVGIPGRVVGVRRPSEATE